MNQNPLLKLLRNSMQTYPLYSKEDCDNPLILAKLFNIA